MNIVDWIRKAGQALMNAPLIAKVMGVILGLTLLLMTSLFHQVGVAWRELETRELGLRGKFAARDLAQRSAPLARRGDTAALQRLVEEHGDTSLGMHSVQVLDHRGNMLAEYRPTHPKASIHTAVAPLPESPGGSVRVAVFDDELDRERTRLTRQVHAATAAVAGLALLSAMWLTRRFTQPMRELVGITREVKDGNYRIRAPVRAKDEIGQLAAAFNDMTDALARKESLRRRLLRHITAAAEEERKRIARELHDQTGQTLTALIAGLSALDGGPNATSLRELRDLATRAYEEVHDLARVLRPSVLDDLGLTAALRELGRGYASRFGVSVDCQAIGLDEGARLPTEIEVALYRIAQESLTNAVRHGQAHAVQILLQRRNGNILTVIEDDGCGFDASRSEGSGSNGGHLGLLGIEERVALLGGCFRVESRSGAGTGLFVEIPLEDQVHV